MRYSWRSAVSAVFAELRAQGRLQLQAADEQALLQVTMRTQVSRGCGKANGTSHVASHNSTVTQP